MMPVRCVERIDIAVVIEVGMQTEAKQAVIVPDGHLLGDVEERRGAPDAVLHVPHLAAAFPDEQAPIGREGQADRLVPGAADGFLDEAGRERGGVQRRREEQQREEDQPCGRAGLAPFSRHVEWLS